MWPRQVGDRYFTDVVYGNQSGMLTIRVMPFTEKGETVVVKAVRALEDWVVRVWRNGGVRPAHHPLVGDVDAMAFTHSRRADEE
jgi:phosphatidylglycerophosphatase GEP4